MPPRRSSDALSPSSTNDRTRGSSLATRVARATAFAAACAALVAALVSVILSDRLVASEEDRRLRTMAAIVIRELPSPEDEGVARAAAAEEVNALAPESVRIAVRRATTSVLIAGDDQLSALVSGTCTSREEQSGASTMRACAVEMNGYQVIAAANRAPREVGAILVAFAIAAGVAALLAAMMARRTTRWALAPLTHLRETLERVADDGDPAKARVMLSNGAVTKSAPRVADDVREVADVQAALQTLVDRLAASLDTARRFSADAAHELKTPLTVLSAELDLLSEENLDASSRDAVQRLRRRVASLAKLVERLLSLGAAASGKLSAKEAVALEEITRDVIEQLDAPARARVTVHAEAVGTVLGDEVLLHALIENAVDNALKFSGNQGRVEVRISEPGPDSQPDRQGSDGSPMVIIEVIDEGPGISPSDRERAFEPFFRTPESRAQSSTPGHGIGSRW